MEAWKYLEVTLFAQVLDLLTISIYYFTFQTKQFFIPKAAIKSKCKFGDVFGFRISEVLKSIGESAQEQGPRRFVMCQRPKRGVLGDWPSQVQVNFQAASICQGCSFLPTCSRAWIKIHIIYALSFIQLSCIVHDLV